MISMLWTLLTQHLNMLVACVPTMCPKNQYKSLLTASFTIFAISRGISLSACMLKLITEFPHAAIFVRG